MSKPKIIKYNYRKTYLELYGAKNVCCVLARSNPSTKAFTRLDLFPTWKDMMLINFFLFQTVVNETTRIKLKS